jgi:hypothetical protein
MIFLWRAGALLHSGDMWLRATSLVLPIMVFCGCVGQPGPSGERGLTGERGPRGEPGESGTGIAKGDVHYLASAATGKAGEEPTAFVVCANKNDALISGGCDVKADGPYEVLADHPDNTDNTSKVAGWTCKIRILKNTPSASVTARAFCLRQR